MSFHSLMNENADKNERVEAETAGAATLSKGFTNQLIGIVEDISEDLDPEAFMNVGFRMGTGDVLHAEKGSLLSSLVRVLKKMQSVKSKNSNLWSESDRKSITKALKSFKVKLSRKVGTLFSKGEDWPTTLLMSLLYSNQTADKILDNLPKNTSNGYKRFGDLTGRKVNSLVEVVGAIKSNLVLGDIPEDIIDDFLASLWAKFTE